MDRRHIVLVGLALAVLGPGSQRAPAQPTGAPTTSPADLPMPAELPAEVLPPAAAMPPPPPPEGGPIPAEPAASPPGSLPPVPGLPAPDGSPAPTDAPRDPQFRRSQGPPLGARPAAKGAERDENPLPPASGPPGQPGAGTSAIEADPFVLPAERLPMGSQAVGLTVNVIGPKVLNLNQEAALKIVVRNTGTADAMGVVVRDKLPDSLTFLSSQPEAQRGEGDTFLFWRLNTVPASSEQVIIVKVKPFKVGPFDHAATVTMQAGGKSRTIVREPKLKVEQVTTSGKVLKGQPVHFKITISNPGDGPARRVVVQAKLSPGLRVDSGSSSNQNVFDVEPFDIEPGHRVVLDPLVADTVQAGEQSCLVVAQSDDVTTSQEESQSTANVTVIEPKLKLAVSGEAERYTDTIANYVVAVENPGSATARNVTVQVTLPLSGRLIVPPPAGARWNESSGRLVWTIAQIDPGEKEKVTLAFQVRMGNVGFYQVTAEAKGDGGLYSSASTRTDVIGVADCEIEVVEQRRFVDVGDTTAFKIRIKNIGTKEATNLLVKAVLSKNIEPGGTNNGTADPTAAKFHPSQQLLVFPPIDRLGNGKEVVLGIKVKATEKGLGTCRVFLMHDDLGKDESLEDMSAFKITAPRN